jgi:hypothetical protein
VDGAWNQEDPEERRRKEELMGEVGELKGEHERLLAGIADVLPRRSKLDHCAFLGGRLRSLKGCEVIDGLPHYVLELTLQELVGMCQFGRATGAYQPWSLEGVSTVGHWKEDQGPFGPNSF